MKHWIKTNLKNIIVTAFVAPILLVAFVSISHVTTFYGLSNPLSWAIYLSVAIEIAALAALAAVSVRMGRFVYLPFFIVTLIQFVGNLYFSFTYIDENSDPFKQWMSLVGTFFEPMGIDPTDPIAHKRVLAFLSGGLLPLISLTFAHMLVVYTDHIEDNMKEENIKKIPNLTEEELDKISKEAGKLEYINSQNEKPGNFQNLDKIEEYLSNLKPINKELGENQEIQVESVLNPDQPMENQYENIEQPIEQVVINEIPSDTDVETKPSENEPTIKRLVYKSRNG